VRIASLSISSAALNILVVSRSGLIRLSSSSTAFSIYFLSSSLQFMCLRFSILALILLSTLKVTTSLIPFCNILSAIKYYKTCHIEINAVISLNTSQREE